VCGYLCTYIWWLYIYIYICVCMNRWHLRRSANRVSAKSPQTDKWNSDYLYTSGYMCRYTRFILRAYVVIPQMSICHIVMSRVVTFTLRCMCGLYWVGIDGGGLVGSGPASLIDACCGHLKLL